MWTRDKTYDTVIEGLPPDNDEFYLRHKLFSEEDERINQLINLMKLTEKALNVAQKKRKLIKETGCKNVRLDYWIENLKNMKT